MKLAGYKFRSLNMYIIMLCIKSSHHAMHQSGVVRRGAIRLVHAIRKDILSTNVFLWKIKFSFAQ